MNRRGGFTLIEVLCTLVITSIMLGSVYSVFLGTLSAKKYCDEIKDAGHRGQAILLMIQRDVQGALEVGGGQPSMEGVDASESGSETDRLNFVSTQDTRCGNDRRDYNEVGYYVVASAGGKSLSLVRREDALCDDDPFDGGVEEVLDDSIASFDLEYLAPEGAWTGEWTAAGLPSAVRITLVLLRRQAEGEDGRKYTYSAVVPVPAAR